MSILSLKVVDPVAVINTISENYQNIQINLIGNCKVMAEDSLSSAIENLIRNAIDHGGVNQVDVIIEEEEKNCRIIVADQGYGVPDSIKGKIFDEGFHYGSTGKTGMGLFIARKIIESFGGQLTIEDNEPQGTRFIIILRKAI